jgi:hypothetical protein
MIIRNPQTLWNGRMQQIPEQMMVACLVSPQGSPRKGRRLREYLNFHRNSHFSSQLPL